MKNTYTQCKLRKNSIKMITWIPTELAIKGNKVNLKEQGEWSKNWIIEEVWTMMDAETVEKNKDEYRYHRKKIDI